MKLAKREKVLVGVAGGLAVLFVILQLLVFPFLDKMDGLRSGVDAKETALHEMQLLREEYLSSRQGYQSVGQFLAQRKKGFTLFPFLEEAASVSAIKGNIKYMKPSESTGEGDRRESQVEMKLEKVSLQQLVDFLGRIESPENVVSVRRITIQESKSLANALDVILQVVTFE
ncbi:MAG: hypothetical protein OEL66_10785 [Desulfobulbaceae bacterium]|nr:hypothetical protein [Desulfobulbaceae bacterium]